MTLPRLALFKSMTGSSISINHIVIVDGEIYRPLCIRNPIKRGSLINPEKYPVTCSHCKNRGWIKSIGFQQYKTKEGRYLTREERTRL